MCIPAYRIYGEYRSLEDAMDNCYNQDDCIAVYDYLCDGTKLSLCTTGFEERKSKFASCIYKKGYGKTFCISNLQVYMVTK